MSKTVHNYGQEVYDFISSHIEGMPYSELVSITNETLGTNFTKSSLKAYCKNHNLKNGLKHQRGVKRPLRIYTEEIIQFINENYIGTGHQDMADMVNDKFGTSYTKTQIKGFYGNHNLNSGRTGRFEKGQQSFNKGKKQTEFMSAEAIERTKATRFSKGHMPKNHREVGSERVNVDGYVEIKVAEPNKWELKHRYIWEQTNGKLPEGAIIRFLDGNKQNCSPDNLVLVSSAEHLEITRRYFVSKNPEITKAVVGIAKLNVAERRKRVRNNADN